MTAAAALPSKKQEVIDSITVSSVVDKNKQIDGVVDKSKEVVAADSKLPGEWLSVGKLVLICMYFMWHLLNASQADPQAAAEPGKFYASRRIAGNVTTSQKVAKIFFLS